ncbi:MAG: aminoacyl--tRNA ligase-related protein [Nanoarchaeota archaeon]
MDTNKFNEYLKKGDIINLDYPLQGALSYYAYGLKLLNNIVSPIFQEFEKAGYMNVKFPEIVPEAFIKHLNKADLFKVKYVSDAFYLAASSEMQASHLASSIFRNYKDFPIKFFSESNVYRKGKSQPLIKGIEYNSYEINSFFMNKKDLDLEIKKINKIMSSKLKNLGIDYIILRQEKNSGPYIYYSYFAFSDSFGSIFWINDVGDKYIKNFSKGYLSEDHKNKYPLHLNGGITTRIFAAYLSNHLDNKGFIIDKEFCPYNIFIPTLGFSSKKLKEITNLLDQKKYNYTIKDIERRNMAYEKFYATGIPVLIAPGNKEIQICSRIEDKQKWINKNELLKQIEIKLKKPTKKISKIKVIESASEKNNKNNGMVFKVKEKDKNKFMDKYKFLGYFQDNDLAFVEKKY